MNDPLITAENLGKRYGSFDALKSCSFQIQPGQVYGLVGGNGAGKTTLLRTLLGFICPTSGSSKIGGNDSWQNRTETHRLLTYLPAQPQLPKLMRARDVLKFFCGIRKEAKLERGIQLCEKLDLDLSSWVVLMSTGMRQKLAIAVTLCSDVPLIILDEPTANLDPTIQSILLGEIETAKKAGKTILFSTHIMSEVDTVCDRVAVLKKGEFQGEFQLTGGNPSHKISARLPVDRQAALSESINFTVSEEEPLIINITTDRPLESLLPVLTDSGATDLSIRAVGVSDYLGEGFWREKS